MLKLMQALESAQQPSSGSDTSSAYRTLKTRLEAAKQGGVCPSFMQPAKGQLLNLLMAEVKKAVETALKTRPGRQARLKTGAVRAALDQAETLLEEGLGDEAEPFLSSAQNWRALHVKTGVNGQQLPGRLAGEAGGGKPVLEDLMAIPDAAAVKRMLGEAYRSIFSTWYRPCLVNTLFLVACFSQDLLHHKISLQCRHVTDVQIRVQSDHCCPKLLSGCSICTAAAAGSSLKPHRF